MFLRKKLLIIIPSPFTRCILTEEEFIHALQQNQNVVHKVCNLYRHTPQGKEDLFQEIVLNAWKGSKHFKGSALFSTWLYRVALNTAITFLRKEKRQVETFALNPQFTLEDESTPLQDEQVNALYKAIGELSDIEKAVVMLYLEDFGYQEMAGILGITANNVAVKINRIKAKLKEASKKYLSL